MWCIGRNIEVRSIGIVLLRQATGLANNPTSTDPLA